MTEKPIKKDNRGGYRPGSGRQRSADNLRTCTFYLPTKTIEKLKQLSIYRRIARGRIIADLVDRESLE